MCRDHRMDTPKLTTVLHFGQWPHQKVNTVPQIDLTIRGASSLIRICFARRQIFSKCVLPASDGTAVPFLRWPVILRVEVPGRVKRESPP